MKKLWILPILWLTASSGFAQNSRSWHTSDEQFEASKIAFMTSKLDLSPSEAKAFWPVYNAYEKSKDKLRSSLKRYKSEEMADLSHKEIEVYLESTLNYERQKLKIKEELIKDLRDILPTKKVAMLFAVENEFRRELINRMRKSTNE